MKTPKAFWIGVVCAIGGCTQLLELDQEYRPSQTSTGGSAGASTGGVAGAGGSSACGVDGDCVPTGNPCSENKCIDGACVASNLPAGSSCGGGLCNGMGACKKTNGSPCMLAAECSSGNCIEGYCCDSTCKQECKACNVPGSLGQCTSVPAGYTDDTCASPKSCDGTQGGNSCTTKYPMGYPCTLDTQCGSGTCTDGVCCSSSCTAVCKSCNVAGSTGVCSNLPPGQEDGALCSGANTCDGMGACKTDTGQGCAAADECLSNFCIDGVCCNTSCLAICQACNVTGTVGTCVNVPLGQEDPIATTMCTGVNSCNGAGVCLLDNGQPCTLNAQCVSGNCTAMMCQ